MNKRALPRLLLVALVAASGCFNGWYQGPWVGVDPNGHVATTATVRCPAPAPPTQASIAIAPGVCDNGSDYLVQIGDSIACSGPMALNDGVMSLLPGTCTGGGSISGRIVDSADPFLNAVESFVQGQVVVDGGSCAVDVAGALYPDNADAGPAVCPMADGGTPDGGPDGGAPDGGA